MHYALFHEVWNMRALGRLERSLGRSGSHSVPLSRAGTFSSVRSCLLDYCSACSGLSPRAQVLLSMFPGFLLGLTGMLVLCLVEMTLAAKLGYSHVSQELLRGTRFLIPLCWLSIVCVLSLWWQRLACRSAPCRATWRGSTYRNGFARQTSSCRAT